MCRAGHLLVEAALKALLAQVAGSGTLKARSDGSLTPGEREGGRFRLGGWQEWLGPGAPGRSGWGGCMELSSFASSNHLVTGVSATPVSAAWAGRCGTTHGALCTESQRVKPSTHGEQLVDQCKLFSPAQYRPQHRPQHTPSSTCHPSPTDAQEVTKMINANNEATFAAKAQQAGGKLKTVGLGADGRGWGRGWGR